MRGFITFVLAGAFVILIFSILDEAGGEGVAAQVQTLEKKYYFEMDVKQAIAQSVRQGAREAEAEFARCVAAGNCKSGLRDLVRQRVGARIRGLGEHLEADREWNVGLWCGKTSGEELDRIARWLGASGAGGADAFACAQCKSAKEGCEEFVDVDLARRAIRLQKGEIFFGSGEISAVGFGALEKRGEISFEAYFPPWVEIVY